MIKLTEYKNFIDNTIEKHKNSTNIDDCNNFNDVHSFVLRNNIENQLKKVHTDENFSFFGKLSIFNNVLLEVDTILNIYSDIQKEIDKELLYITFLDTIKTEKERIFFQNLCNNYNTTDSLEDIFRECGNEFILQNTDKKSFLYKLLILLKTNRDFIKSINQILSINNINTSQYKLGDFNPTIEYIIKDFGQFVNGLIENNGESKN